MSEEKRARPKELPQSQARGYAREIIDGVFSGGDWSNLLSRTATLPAAHRRTVLETVKVTPIPNGGRAQRSRILDLALVGLRPGPTRSSDFVNSLVAASFDFCSYVDPRGEIGVLKELLAKILSSALDSSDKDLSEILQIDPERLVKNDSFAIALTKLLESAEHEELMRKTIGYWGALVGAHLAARRELSGMSRSAAGAALQRMAGLSIALIPAELMLSVPWLIHIAGGISSTLSEASPFNFIPASLKDPSSSGPDKKEVIARPAPAVLTRAAELLQVEKNEPDVAKILSPLVTEIEKLLVRHEAANEERRTNLSAQLAKITQELAQERAELKKSNDEIGALEASIQSLNQTLSRVRGEHHELETQGDELRADCARWRKEAEVLLASKNQQVEDAKAEAKRELKRSTLSQLLNLRTYVVELEALKAGPAKFAATTLDGVIRTLHRQGYVTAVELPRIRQSKNEESEI